MINVVITAIVSFISTNIDDIFVLMLLFSQVNENAKKINIVIGQFIGIGFLFAVSIMGIYGINILPQKYIGLLGILPIILGIKALIESVKNGEAEQEVKNIAKGNKQSRRELRFLNREIMNVIIITISNGADNVGIYIPAFSGYSASKLIVTSIVFTILTAAWCAVGSKIADYPLVKSRLKKYKHIVEPVVFIGLGIYIIIESNII
jgi:cadmium resistance transport/sequestration family protein